MAVGSQTTLTNLGHEYAWRLLSSTLNHRYLVSFLSQGRIIHEAGEAEASRPVPRQGPGLPGTMNIYKVGPLWAPKFLERKFAVF